jgi:3-aminobutyryl-CoA ammonia-lyase
VTQSDGPNPGGATDPVTASIRVRLAPHDARYAGGLVAGSKALEIFADLETELALREGGDEGLCAGYESIEFLAPLHAGDFVEARAWIVGRGKTSRKLEAELYKVLSVDENGIGGAEDPPVLAVRARATIVVGTHRAAADVRSS